MGEPQEPVAEQPPGVPVVQPLGCTQHPFRYGPESPRVRHDAIVAGFAVRLFPVADGRRGGGCRAALPLPWRPGPRADRIAFGTVPTDEDPALPQTEYRQSRFQPPPGATELFLVRHGESEPARLDSPFPLVDGQGDPNLSPEGREQAVRVGERLSAENFDAIYVTTLRRTVQTAAPLAARVGASPRVEADLREVHLGEWEGGLFRKMVAEGGPVAQRLFAEERWDVIPGAEPAEVFAARVGDAVSRLAAAHSGERLAVFTHGGVIAQVLALASGSRPFTFLGADNGSISHVVVSGAQWAVRRFNDTAHLDRASGLHSAALT